VANDHRLQQALGKHCRTMQGRPFEYPGSTTMSAIGHHVSEHWPYYILAGILAVIVSGGLFRMCMLPKLLCIPAKKLGK